MIEQSCALARILQPSIVVLEDVDLVAEERTRPGAACTAPLLFELLNQMDGLADDADVLFLLTTNRPDILEPALAARPGRVDQAIEIPLPDAECISVVQLKAPDVPFYKRISGAAFHASVRHTDAFPGNMSQSLQDGHVLVASQNAPFLGRSRCRFREFDRQLHRGRAVSRGIRKRGIT